MLLAKNKIISWQHQVHFIELKLAKLQQQKENLKLKLFHEQEKPSTKKAANILQKNIRAVEMKIEANQHLKAHLEGQIEHYTKGFPSVEEPKPRLIAEDAKRLQQSGCQGKKSHHTHGGAVKALAKLQALGPTGTLHPYKCLFCTKWHLGNLIKS